ncbi:MAG: nucleotidyltransferase domain-containing protein [Clostridiales Family XIII bacterium]|jgi:predicted nucleotidyltransferase|nr:nucleotidyltransferase domain-containing protein [Clostridiales Family XIII bacterium]
MPGRIYDIVDIQRLVKPIAERYGVERVALFGSYARGEATGQSDIDLRVDSGALRGYFKLAGFHRELEERLDARVDVLTTGALSGEFLARIANEEVVLYEQ